MSLRLPLHQLTPETPDAELLAWYVRERDEQAFAALVARHGRMVRAVCRRVLGNDADADDATQATLLVLIRRAGSIRDRHGLANWLFGVAHNVAVKAKQTRTRRAAREAKAASRPPEQVVSDFAELLHVELAKLPATYRAAVVLCDLEGHTLADAAKHLGIPTGTVASRLARGREQLAGRLRKIGLGVSTGLLAPLLADIVTAAVVFSPSLSPHIHLLAEESMRTLFTTPMLAKRTAIIVGALVLVGVPTALVARAAPPHQHVNADPPAKVEPKPAAKDPSSDEVLGLAKKSADEIEKDSDRLDTWMNLAVEYGAIGDKKQAKEVFDTAITLANSRPDLRSNASWIARRMAESKLELPTELVESIQNVLPAQSADLLAQFAAQRLEGTGDLKALAKLAADAEGETKDYFLSCLAREQIVAGKLTDAEKTLGELKGESTRVDVARVRVLTDLAVAQSKAKDEKAAARSLAAVVSLADRIGQSDRRAGSYAQSFVALAQAQAGDLKAARTTAEGISDPDQRDRTLAGIAWIECEAGDPVKAVKALEEVSSEYHTSKIRAKIARYYATKQDWKQATAVIEATACVYWKVRAQRELAVLYAKAGKEAEAGKAFATADELAGPEGEYVKDTEPGYVGLRSHIVYLRFRTCAEMGRVKEAVEEARKIEDPMKKTYALMNIARAFRARLPSEEE